MGSQTPYSKTVPAADREALYRKKMRAAELRRLGYRWEEISAECGYANKSGAFHAVQSLMREHQSLAYDEIALYRQESLDRLTDLLKVAMEKAIKGDEKMMREARLIISQIGDLTGEKAPVKVEIGESDVDRLLREAEAELGRRTAAAQVQAAKDQAGQRPDHAG